MRFLGLPDDALQKIFHGNAERLRQRVQETLERHQPSPLPDGVKERLREIIRQAQE